MDRSAALTVGLAALSEALDDDTDLESLLQSLVDDVKAAVESYLGLTMTLVTDTHEVSFTVREAVDGREITASLRIPLGADSGSNGAHFLLLYAAVPGAFVDLAADLSYALALGPAVLVLDAHLSAPDGDAGLAGLAGHSAINQAIGVLIDRGHTPESARGELRRLAAVNDVSLPAAAEGLLGSVVRKPPAGDASTS